ncbi:Autophagy-related protein 13 [Penicillium argentinense]|uniref:Autophagy-related protein 13 n=1 Tax=Penicillium argentinense TaxID=1131581 RepID=A0A9W9EXY7_9EURO|nr:Autophagy-related protein 13 [Penicillium argentinense]KAJ5089855.1 Autophagy-related protein 13 [Penicillium argentinense]
MHQHPRSPAVPSPAPKPPARAPAAARDDVKDNDSIPPSPTVDIRTNSTKGLGIDAGADASEPKMAAPSKESMAKLNQIVSNYHTKSALIILHSRVDLPPAYLKDSDKPRINRWFNVELNDSDAIREQLWVWRTCDATDNRPPPLIIETYLDTKSLTNNQSLVILDENGKRWDVQESLDALRDEARDPYQSDADEIILERWTIELGEAVSDPPADLGSILPTVYKKSIVLFRSLFTYSKFLPAWKFSKRNTKLRQSPTLKVKYRIIDGNSSRFVLSPDTLTTPLYEGNGKVVDTYNFGVTESPAGPFSVKVAYRTNCDFRVDDSEALLSSRFMGADDDIFRPSLPSDDSKPNPEIGSVPVETRTVENPDCSRAYGSLSTFHQVGPPHGTSPISALRAARDAAGSSSPSGSPSKKLLPAAKIAPTGRAAKLASEGGGSNFGRRPSVSFQPFKAPPLSASPALVDTPLGVSPRTVSARIPTGTSADSRVMPPPSVAASARKPAAIASEQAFLSPTSASPKPAPITRYSSSFSHRRGRPSSGGMSKPDDDHSSGKASAASSNVQPGSGLLAEATGTSAESIHADDENISEFLKMLDLKKDLMNTSSSISQETGPRKPTATSAALARFQRMRDSNAALSDSMSASMHLRQSSNSSSKQLSGVPQMVAGTSISTASSPGKPISPHTPHTPAIRSRLSSNSVVDEIATEHDRRVPHIEHNSPLEENPGMESTQRDPSTAAAIDIPMSPRVYPPAYRRSSSAAQRIRPIVADDDEIFPFGMRSVSLGNEEAAHPVPNTLQRRMNEDENQDPNLAGRPSTEDANAPATSATGASRRSATSSVSNAHLYQPRFASSRGRGYSGGQSLSSASSSLARGSAIPPHLAERDADRDGNASGSTSGNSTMELRRGSGQRPSASRAPPSLEDDEPLLFAMSDFGASRRSLEENRGNHGGADSNSGSRRGSGRRGAGLPNFHVW